jgi:mannose-1-phosphate guanylyltransferase
VTNLILCGGAGTRLWPLSRRATPKQFVDLIGGQTLFGRTVARNLALVDSYIIVTGAEQYPLAKAQFKAAAHGEMKVGFILEPLGRNTAPAIALACLGLPPEEIVLVTPSDHEITDQKAYLAAAAVAREAAEEGWLATFGITAAYPETGYGYIEAGTPTRDSLFLSVRAFKEKPDLSTAEAYVKAGRYYWNSGMFCFSAGRFLEELGRYAPAMLETAKKAREAGIAVSPKGQGAPDVVTIPKAEMEAIPAQSIDYAVMEKADRVAVVPCDIGWNDLGSWDAIYEIRSKDGSHNASNEGLMAINSTRNLVMGPGKRIILLDVEDLIVIDTPDALLVARRSRSQDVKAVVDALKAGGLEDQGLL